MLAFIFLLFFSRGQLFFHESYVANSVMHQKLKAYSLFTAGLGVGAPCRYPLTSVRFYYEIPAFVLINASRRNENE